MRKILKRLISLTLVVALLATLTFSVAATIDSSKSKIISALQNMEWMKDDIGLADVDFRTLSIAEPMYTYEYTSRGWIQNNVIYPLLSNGVLVAWAISLDRNGDEEYQITAELVKEVKSILAENTSFTLLYDDTCCYLYDGNVTHLLKQNGIQVKSRTPWVMNVNELPMNANLTDISDAELLGYTVKMTTYAQTYYECPVSFVTQKPYSNLCWAASTACVVNYVKGKNYTAVDVAKKYYGNTDYNKKADATQVVSVLRNKYFLLYSHKEQKPGDGIIGHNIQKGYPVIGLFSSYVGAHAVVICGINIVSGYIKIMDPNFGFCSAIVSSAGYQYTNASTGITYTFGGAICRYWTV